MLQRERMLTTAVRLAWTLGLATLTTLACGDSEEGVSDPSPPQDEATAAGGGIILFTTYYSEPEHIHRVGQCVRSTCPPKGTRCTGIKTQYFELDDSECN